MDRSLLVGEMADFEYAFPPRGAPEIPLSCYEGEAVSLKLSFRGRDCAGQFLGHLVRTRALKNYRPSMRCKAELGGGKFRGCGDRR